MGGMKGMQSLLFENKVYIVSAASIVGKLEGEGPLGKYFDKVEEDPMMGQDSWEEAESRMQLNAARLALEKAKLQPEDLRMVFTGDLLAQSIASSFGIVELERPVYGLFGACSTMGEALSLGAMAVNAGYAQHVMAVTSSHFGSAEKEFRFPLAYGNQRPPSATWTVTGSAACVLGPEKSGARITGVTSGRIVDYGLKDSQNMGGLYGSGCLRYHLPPISWIWTGSRRSMTASSPEIWERWER